MKKGISFLVATVILFGLGFMLKSVRLSKGGFAGSGTPAHSLSDSPSPASLASVTDPSLKNESSKEKVEVKKESAPESNCFSFEYRHFKEARNRDVEDFLDYSNAFPIHHPGVNPKSICVKVNDKPVPFKFSKTKTQEEVIIGSVVGPESVIHVAYCTGSAPCREACTVKSNQMMDDLMSDAGDAEDFKDSWGDTNAPAQVAQKKELQENVKTLRNVASENSDLNKSSVMRNWDTLKSKDWFCKAPRPHSFSQNGNASKTDENQ